MVRQFRIVGITTGKEYSLNDYNKYLITLPHGLGFEYKNNFIQLANQRLRVSQERVYKEIGGTIEVSGNTRDIWETNYNELRDFIASNKKDGFRLYYKNILNDERYVVCDIKILEKTEKTSYCILVPIQLEPRSLWLKDNIVNTESELQPIDNTVMAFLEDNDFAENDEYRYNYGFYEDETNEYVVKFYVEETGIAILINNSDEETPLIITIYGECENPHFQLVDVNNKTIQEGKIFITLDDGEKLILNSNPEQLSITVYENIDGEIISYDITNKIDLSLKNFITLPVGQYKLVFNDSSSKVINANIQFSNRYIGG